MTEHAISDPPTAAERAAVDTVLSGARSRDQLLPALHALNDAIGHITRGGLGYVCQQLGVAPADAYGVATFYGLLSVAPRPPRLVHVCTDLACSLAGADQITAELAGATPDRHAAWQPSPCLGLCDRAPAALITHAGSPPYAAPIGHADTSRVEVALKGGLADEWAAAAAVPQQGQPELVLLRRVGQVDPESIESYLAHGGFAALARARQIGAAEVIRRVEASGMVGRGGAAFPTARKWAAVAQHPRFPHYLVCNADESEPGTFKDRVLLEADPFAVVESIAIAAFATGCEHAYVYLRGEYPVAHARLQRAIEASAAHLAGLTIEIRRGAGAYICGEETALFNSIEGFRGEPRSKPPYPTDVGLFGQPTVVNNVETLVGVLPVLIDGRPADAKLFCLSGAVTRPGLYEARLGITLRELLARAGGVRGGRPLQTVLLGGAAGAFVTPDELDVVLDFDAPRAIGASLGSGVVMVLDDTADPRAFTTKIAEFFAHESCGQCVPCRVGTVHQLDALARRDKVLLHDVAQVMRDASICGLGQTAASAVESAVKKLGILS